MDTVETQEYKGYTINVYPDIVGEENDPRRWSNLGTMVCFHGRANLGDEHFFDHPHDLVDFIQDKNIISLPLYLYEHSGCRMNTEPFSCCWDSGQVGYIYVDLETIREEYGVKRVSAQLREKVKDVLQSEVDVYDNYIAGFVYGYNVEDSDGDEFGGVWGYYGFDYEQNGLLEAARDEIDVAIKTRRDSRATQLKTFIRHKVPLYKRTFVIR